MENRKTLSNKTAYGTFETPYDDNNIVLSSLITQFIDSKKFEAQRADEITANLAKLPNLLLTYFFAEIALQIRENGCIEYDKRQPKSIQNVMNAWQLCLAQKGGIGWNEQDEKNIHKNITDTTKMRELNKEDKGEFRQLRATVVISKSIFTPEGIEDLLNKIDSQELGNLFLADFDHFKKRDSFSSVLTKSKNEIYRATMIAKELSALLDNAIKENKSENEIKNIKSLIDENNNHLDSEQQKIQEINKQILQLSESILTKDNLEKMRKQLGFTTNKELAEHLLKTTNQTFIIGTTDRDLEKLMQKANMAYQEGLSKIQHASAEEKLYFFMNSMKNFLLLHPFYDANLRTFLVILYTDMINNKLYPPVFFNPFVFFSLDVPQLIEACKLGMANTLAMIDAVENGNRFFDFKIDHYTDNQKQTIKSWTQSFCDYLHSKHPDIRQKSISDLIAAKKFITSQLLHKSKEFTSRGGSNGNIMSKSSFNLANYYNELINNVIKQKDDAGLFSLLESSIKNLSQIAPEHCTHLSDIMESSKKLYSADNKLNIGFTQ